VCQQDGYGILGDNGQVYGGRTFGVFMTVCLVLIHHVQVGIHVRDWSTLYTAIFVASLLSLPLAIYWTNDMPTSSMYKSFWTVVFSSPIIWLMILLVVGAVSVPLIAVRRWRCLIQSPKFYARD